MNKEEALRLKEAEIQLQLDQWLRTSNLFSPGDAVRITLSLERVPTTIVESAEIKMYLIKDTGYYQYIGTKLSGEDWNQLLTARLKKEMQNTIKYLRSVNNIPTRDVLLLGGVSSSSSIAIFNRILRSQGIKFQLVRVGLWCKNASDTEHRNFRLYQLYKVEPKKPSLKYWK